MKYTRTHDRMGLTAIAAVLALSSTPLAAQEATSPATTTEVPAPAPVDPAVDPLAPAPTPEVSAPAETTTTATEATVAAPAAKPATKSVAKRTVKKATSTAPKPATTAKTTAPDAPAPAPMAEAAPAPAPVAAEPAPVEAAPAPAQTAEKPKIDEALPVAGGAGALILALAGAGMAVRRRKRREEDELALDRQAYAENTEAAAWEPSAAEEPAPAWSEPVIEAKPLVAPAAMQATEVSEDFDTSGFGRHVKAAYAGPTPENPSLSLRKRLKIAGELDRREKASGIAPTHVEAAAKPVSIPATMPSAEKPAMSFGGSAKQVKWPEYQL